MCFKLLIFFFFGNLQVPSGFKTHDLILLPFLWGMEKPFKLEHIGMF